MNRFLLGLAALLLMGGCEKSPEEVADAAESTSPETAVVTPPATDGADLKKSNMILARKAVREFSTALKSELGAAMQTGGAVNAIAVCNTRAMPISESMADKHGVQLSRVSLKNRNPDNMPNKWQAAVLNRFESQKAAGKDVSKLAWSKIVDVGGQSEFRYMKAIPTTGICLQCHGTEIAPGVAEALAALYPRDRATGFAPGDIRGAFVVTRKIQ